MPTRFQRQCTQGYRLPEGAIYVGRPTPWGNPFRVWRDDAGRWTISHGEHHWTAPTREAAHQRAVELYAATCTSRVPEIITALRGKDLVCWCPLDLPCHAEVLLHLANAPLAGDPPADPPDRVCEGWIL
jgi:Domain of unknown function (DUF4326)